MRVEKLRNTNAAEIRFDIQNGHYNGLLLYTTQAVADAVQTAITVKLRGTRVETPVNNMELGVFNAIADLKHGQFNASRALFESVIAAGGTADNDPQDDIEIKERFITYIPLGSVYPSPANEMDIFIDNPAGLEWNVCGISVAKDYPNLIQYDIVNDANYTYSQVNELFALRSDNTKNPSFSIKYDGDDITADFDDLNIATQIFSETETHNPKVAVLYRSEDDLPEDIEVRHDAQIADIDILATRVIAMPQRYAVAHRMVERTLTRKMEQTARKSPEIIRAKRTVGMTKKLNQQ